MTISPKQETALASGEGWLEGWEYRLDHTISSSPGAGTDYQVKMEIYYEDKFDITYYNASRGRCGQGIAVDTDYIYCTDNANLTMWTRATGALYDSRDTTSDGTAGDHLEGIWVNRSSDYLYVVAFHDATSNTYIKRYNKTNLDYIDDIKTIAHNAGHAITDIDWKDSLWWTIFGSANPSINLGANQTFIQTYNSTWDFQSNYTLPFIITSDDDDYYSGGYEGFTWLEGDYIITSMHENAHRLTHDIYKWTGSAFEGYDRINRLEWDNPYNAYDSLAVTGIDSETIGSDEYVWFASRDFGGAADNYSYACTKMTFDDTHFDNDEIGLEGKCQSDFDDLRFTEDDGDTLLDYWIESYYDASVATVWVEIADDLSSSSSLFYLYYGNSGVSTTSNGTATFILFDEFNTKDSSTWNFSTGTSVSDGKLKVDSAGDYFYSWSDFGPNISCEALLWASDNWRFNFGFAESWPPSGAMWILHNWDVDVDDNGDIQGYEGNADTSAIPYNMPSKQYHIESIMWGMDYGEIYSNRWKNVTTTDSDIPDSAVPVGLSTWGSGFTDVYVEWLFLRNWIEDEPAHSTWGSEEHEMEWNEINIITIYLLVPFNMWGINTAIILLGLVIIPASTMYLIIGAKHDRSSDRLYYGLVAFFIGWALLIGGIMP